MALGCRTESPARRQRRLRQAPRRPPRAGRPHVVDLASFRRQGR